MHPNENPTLQLVFKILDETNYHTWRCAMVQPIKMKNKCGFIDRSILMPDPDDDLFHAWEQCHTFVFTWLRFLVSPSIAQSILWIEKVKDV